MFQVRGQDDSLLMRISCPAVVCASALCASPAQFVLAAPELDALHAKQFQPVVCYIAPPPRHASGITLSMPVGYCATARGVLLRPRARIHVQKPRAKDGAMNCKVFTRKRRVGRRAALEAANSAASAPAERRGTFEARRLHRAALLAHNPRVHSGGDSRSGVGIARRKQSTKHQYKTPIKCMRAYGTSGRPSACPLQSGCPTWRASGICKGTAPVLPSSHVNCWLRVLGRGRKKTQFQAAHRALP